MDEQKLTRRDFLRLSSMAAAGVALAACAKTPTEAPAEPTKAPEEPTKAPEEPTKAPEEPTATPEPQTSGYGEAPAVSELVAQGKLPTADERVPMEARVLAPPRWGTGVWRDAAYGRGADQPVELSLSPL